MKTTIGDIRNTSAFLDSVATSFEGELIVPGDQEYEEARHVWNGMIDRYPAVIARCMSPADVQRAIALARKYELPIAVRGGGHNVAGFGTCDDGMVIDVRPMNSVVVDPKARLVRAGAGCNWGEVDAATQAYGLATPGGVVSDTGIAGLTLGGGFGYLASKYGTSSDNLVEVELVTADGQLLTASDTENPDLFWALRGGGGNFGVVTSFTYRLHPVGPDVFMLMVLHDGTGDAMKQAMQAYRSFAQHAPDEAAPLVGLGMVPPGSEHFPEAIHGKPFVMMLGMYVGDPAEGEAVYAPLRNFATPLADMSAHMPYVEAQRILDEEYPRRTMRYYWKSTYTGALTDEALDILIEHARRQPSAYSTIDVWRIGGVLARMDDGATAFSGRRNAFMVNPEANWIDPADDEANIQWVRDTLGAMKPFAEGGRYFNFPGFHEEGESAMRETFGAKYDRLVDIKQKYDPNNVFRINQNIGPRSANGHEKAR